MKTVIDRLFLDHPRTIGESYFGHLKFAFGFAAQLTLAGLCALIHGLVPCLFKDTASKKIKALHQRMTHR